MGVDSEVEGGDIRWRFSETETETETETMTMTMTMTMTRLVRLCYGEFVTDCIFVIVKGGRSVRFLVILGMLRVSRYEMRL
jgi:hypothetical protein